MPSSLFGELGGGLVEDQRAFQLALELSMLNFGETLPSTNPLASPLGFAPPPDDRTKKSQNMTECVPVPSSEHVAEIVGRQDNTNK
ncbi:RNA-binding protein MEX3B-like [Zerene cesonia]|uniref:RNA-binding protein MEX3B-like n=1 Tax=Zerene cesonia TaxID=33412 RepID=UPI0018E5548D|nr:RNA-binding protein MEX3B-like [Zerene cesonia]